MGIESFYLILTLNVNNLNSPIKRHRMAEWIKKKKQDPIISVSKILSLGIKTHTDWEWGDGKTYQVNCNNKKKSWGRYILHYRQKSFKLKIVKTEKKVII